MDAFHVKMGIHQIWITYFYGGSHFLLVEIRHVPRGRDARWSVEGDRVVTIISSDERMGRLNWQTNTKPSSQGVRDK